MAGGIMVIDRSGQVTIAAEIREALGLKEGDQVEITLDNGNARLVPHGSAVNRPAGLFRHGGPVLSAEEFREAAEVATAESQLERSTR